MAGQPTLACWQSEKLAEIGLNFDRQPNLVGLRYLSYNLMHSQLFSKDITEISPDELTLIASSFSKELTLCSIRKQMVTRNGF